MVGDILDLLRRECVVHADRSAARMHDPQVRDHVLGHVPRHDQGELVRAEAEIAERESDRSHLLAIATPRERLPIAVVLPAQRRPIAPPSLGVREDRRDGLARDRPVDVGSFGDYVHLLTPSKSDARRARRTYTIPPWG